MSTNQYAMTSPCVNCPFRKVGGIRLSKERAKEIASHDGSFPCHKTTSSDEDGNPCETGKEKACAGFLIFNEKRGRPNQMMRIAERLGMYDPTKLRGHDEVFGSMAEMLRASEDRRRRNLRKNTGERI